MHFGSGSCFWPFQHGPIRPHPPGRSRCMSVAQARRYAVFDNPNGKPVRLPLNPPGCWAMQRHQSWAEMVMWSELFRTRTY